MTDAIDFAIPVLDMTPALVGELFDRASDDCAGAPHGQKATLSTLRRSRGPKRKKW